MVRSAAKNYVAWSNVGVGTWKPQNDPPRVIKALPLFFGEAENPCFVHERCLFESVEDKKAGFTPQSWIGKGYVSHTKICPCFDKGCTSIEKQVFWSNTELQLPLYYHVVSFQKHSWCLRSNWNIAMWVEYWYPCLFLRYNHWYSTIDHIDDAER